MKNDYVTITEANTDLDNGVLEPSSIFLNSLYKKPHSKDKPKMKETSHEGAFAPSSLCTNTHYSLPLTGPCIMSCGKTQIIFPSRGRKTYRRNITHKR